MRDDEILALLRGSPEKGIKALTAQYGGLVYAVVRRNIGNASGGAADADIEAIAADVFAEFYLELDKYDPTKGSVKAWLCTIARHNAVDAARKTKEALPLDEDVFADENSVEGELEESELRQAVLSEVKSLPEPDREILLRKFYLGESSKEIAKRLKMSVSNVDTRTSRAVERLRKSLKDWR